MTTPPTPALAAIIAEMRAAILPDPGDERPVGSIWLADQVRQLADRLEALSPPDAIRAAPPFTVLPDTAGWDSVNECPTCGHSLHPPSPPKDEGRVGEVPAGWAITPHEDGAIVVSHNEHGGYVARPEGPGIAGVVLHHLAKDLLAPPSGAALRENGK